MRELARRQERTNQQLRACHERVNELQRAAAARGA
jgi:hypothetical protein